MDLNLKLNARVCQAEERSLSHPAEASDLEFKAPTKYGRRSKVPSLELQRTEGRFGPFREREAQCEDGFTLDTQENQNDSAHAFIKGRANKIEVRVKLCF
jgi:hypothetical protein